MKLLTFYLSVSDALDTSVNHIIDHGSEGSTSNKDLIQKLNKLLSKEKNNKNNYSQRHTMELGAPFG